MSRNKNLDLIMDQGSELIEFYRENPCIAAWDLLKVDLAPIQQVVFEDMWFKNNTIVVASRGYGKTYILGVLAVLSCLLKPGYRVGLMGSGFRQCFPLITNSYDTFWTSNGLKTTTHEFYDSIVPNNTKVQSLYNNNIINNKWLNADRDCIKIVTKKGYEVSGTIDHRVLVLSDDFSFKYKELSNIDNSDYLVIKKGFNYFGNNNLLPTFDEFECDWRTKDCLIPKELTPDLSYWMGLLIGDGCISVSKNNKQRVNFTNEDQDLLDSFENHLREYFLIDKEENISRKNRKNNTWEIDYHCKKLVQYLLKCGFTKTTALDKKVPDVIKKANKENMVAFLQGLGDTDGCVYIQNHKHGYTHCEVAFNTSSKQLAKEVQSILLNLGIVSNFGISSKACIKKLKVGNKPSKCAEAYKIRVTGQAFLKKFNDAVGFRCERKNTIFGSYLDNGFRKKESLARHIGLPKNIVDSNYSKCLSYLEQGLYFVKMVDSDYFFAPTIDIEVENEHCYWANGFINHNSKMIFSEVEKLYSRAPILVEACEKRPTRGSDTCYLKFKAVGGYSGSFIEALPLGNDGSKIRGSRFYLICIDELAYVPTKIVDMVIRPFAATTLEPMEKVRRIAHQNKLIEDGLASIEDFEEETVNKMVMTSSGYYKFNHMWRRMKDHWLQMDRSKERSEEPKYAVWQIPYWDLPEGFLDVDNIEESRRTMSSREFRMEYEADMISDSEGFFKASLLEACTNNSEANIEIVGESTGSYILGIDPNQGGSGANCGAVVVKLGTTNKVVNVLEMKKKTTQQLTMVVQDVCEKYNIQRIYMDKGGGGKAVMDLLDEGYNNKAPIIDITDKDKMGKKGRRILEMINFTPSWISDANFDTLALLEDRKLLFPEPPTSTVDLEGRAYEKIELLKKQMLNIIVTQTSSGMLHFDTPKKGQVKDLYSAIILAGYGIKAIERFNEEDIPILHGDSGLVRQRGTKNWNNVNGKGNRSSLNIGSAILNKK